MGRKADEAVDGSFKPSGLVLGGAHLCPALHAGLQILNPFRIHVQFDSRLVISIVFSMFASLRRLRGSVALPCDHKKRLPGFCRARVRFLALNVHGTCCCQSDYNFDFCNQFYLLFHFGSSMISLSLVILSFLHSKKCSKNYITNSTRKIILRIPHIIASTIFFQIDTVLIILLFSFHNVFQL